jgi:hypothetical protein
MAEVTSKNNVVGNDYNKVLDTEFKTFTVSTPTSLNQTTVEEFFQIYDELFYQIPKEGETNSHTYILNKTAEYLGVKLADDASIQALIEEIAGLRRQILADNQTIADLAKIK